MHALVSALLALTSSLAWANGGPVKWTSPGPQGSLAADKPDGLVLKSEDLSLRILDAYSFKAHAVYHLEKTKPGPAKVKFGLPLTWVEDPWAEERDPKAIPSEEKILADWKNDSQAQVELKIGSRSFACQPVKLKDAPQFRGGDPLVPEASGQGTNDPSYLRSAQMVRSWCVAEVEFPSEKGPVDLELTYRSSLVFMDDATSKSPFVNFGPRTLIYPLYPAHSWAADSFKANVDFDPGIFGGSKKNWSLSKADLRKSLTINLQGSELEFWEKAHWNKNSHPNERFIPEVSANKVLAPAAKYGAALAFDGDPATAWCFPDKTGMPNAELTMKIKEGDLARARQHGSRLVVLSGGYQKSKKLFEANGKVKKVQLKACDGSLTNIATQDQVLRPGRASHEPFREAWIAFRPAQTLEYLAALEKKSLTADRNYQNMPAQYDIPTFLGSGCMKLSVLETEVGKEGDTCISEILLIAY